MMKPGARRQFSQNSLDRQYLFEMGIDVWAKRERDQPNDPTLHEQGRNDALAGAGSSSAASVAALASWSSHQLVESLATLPVDPSSSVKSAVDKIELLIVIEGAAPAGESTDLLNNMFDAIKIPATQRRVVVSTAQGTDTLGSVAATVMPAAIVVMASSRINSDRTGNSGSGAVDVSGMKNLRGVQHRPTGIDPWAIVTFHPADLLDCPQAKRPAWEDLKLLRQWLNLPG